ncbi:MAG: hypothetical protein JSU63_05290 [Phycisphaerales bacterium]|nr:MAG: hypothetical protein JSU63_05290 [Phycisphaerales bacterium]
MTKTEPSRQISRTSDVSARVRANTGAAAFTGALLVVIGFFWFDGPLDSDVGLLRAGNTLFLWALRLGGLALIGVAVACSIGVRLALLLHGLTSSLIGIFVVLSAILMMIGDGIGLDCLVFAVCGVMILTTGMRDWADFRKLPSEKIADGDPTLDAELANFGGGLDGPELFKSGPSGSGKPGSRRQRKPGSASDGHLSSLSEQDGPGGRSW